MKVTLDLSEKEIIEAIRYWLNCNYKDYSYGKTYDTKLYIATNEDSSVPGRASVGASVKALISIEEEG